jgi:hypothetical protein
MADTDVTKVTDKIAALSKSNKCIYVITDGGYPHLDQWQNTVDKYNIIAGTTDATPYTSNQAVEGPWHAIATMGMMSSLVDPAVPSTNKQVFGISSGEAGAVQLWLDARKNAIAAVGGLILEDRYNNLFVRHGLTICTDSVEDSESSIVFAEGYMAKLLRDNHQKYIGTKITDETINAIAATTKQTLDSLVTGAIIRSYKPASVYQATNKPTWVYVVFEYKPIYPLNNLKFEWGFDIAG